MSNSIFNLFLRIWIHLMFQLITMKLIRVTAAGEMFQADGERIITAAREASAENKYDILYDISVTTVPYASWFSLPRELGVFKEFQCMAFKAAVLASQSDKAVDDYKFYELVTGNIGLRIRLFFEENEAIEWLLQNRDSKP